MYTDDNMKNYTKEIHKNFLRYYDYRSVPYLFFDKYTDNIKSIFNIEKLHFTVCDLMLNDGTVYKSEYKYNKQEFDDILSKNIQVNTNKITGIERYFFYGIYDPFVFNTMLAIFLTDKEINKYLINNDFYIQFEFIIPGITQSL